MNAGLAESAAAAGKIYFKKAGLRLLETVLGDSSASRHRQRVDHPVAFDEPDRVDQVRDRARVVRHDADAIARLEIRGADHAYGCVLLRQPLDGERLFDPAGRCT